MSPLTWPDTLPPPFRNSWSGQAQDPRQPRATEAGPPGYRRRWSGVARLVNMEIEVDRQGKATFERFYVRATAHGTLPFTMPDPTTHGWKLLASDGTPILNPGGDPILLSAHWLCLFGSETPRESLLGVLFHIQFQVAVMP